MKLIGASFEIIIQIVKGVFDLLLMIFGNRPNDKLHEDYSMGCAKKIRIFSRFNKGLILNGRNYKLSVKNSKIHTCILGKSGIGKSSVFYSVNLLSPNNKSYVVTDLDGGLMKTSSGYLKSIGWNIQVFDLSSVENSCFYNPIDFCSTPDELKSLAIQIINSSSTHSNSSDKFWEHSATKLLFNLLRLVKTQDKKYQNLANVNHLLTMIELDSFDKFVVNNTDDNLFTEIIAFKAIEDKLRTNIEATLSATLDLLSYNDIGFITSKNTIDFERLRKPKSILYIVVPERLIRQYSLIVSVFYSQLFSFFQKHKPKKNTIYFMLDEAGNYRIDQLEILVSILRKFNCSISIAVQNFNQIVNLYGRESAATIYANCSTKIIYPGATLVLSEEISRMSGLKTVEVNFEGRKTQQTRPVLSPTDVMYIKNNEVLIQHSNNPFIKVHTYPFYKQFKLKRRSKIKPPIFKQNTICSPELIPLTPKFPKQ